MREQRHLMMWRFHAFAAVGLAVFILLLFYPLLFTNRVLASGDILLYFYPYRDYAADALRQGRIPLWNPYSFLGVPFLANPQAAVLYPLHWPLIWLPVTKQIYWSAAMHSWLLGYGGYLLMRRWGYGGWGALVAGLTLSGSGFYGGLIGHINQMNGAAWLPWSIWVLDGQFAADPFAANQGKRMGAWGAFLKMRGFYGRLAGLSALVALMLLAGHTQTAYINLWGLGVWAIALPLARRHVGPASHAAQAASSTEAASRGDRQSRFALLLWRQLVERLTLYSGGVFLGLLLAAAQLLPTLELSNLGLRSGGLSYAEVTSFSLKPLKLFWTLLPSYGLVDLGVIFETSGYSEFVAYVGVTGLLLATLGLWNGRARGWGVGWLFGLVFSLLGLFLAAGRWNPFYYLFYLGVPGFDLFRTPARWLMLYTMGMAVLAGIAVDWAIAKATLFPRLSNYLLPARSSLFPLLLTLLVALDLLLAANALPHAQTTAPQAVTDLRTGPAHLLTDPVRAQMGPAAMGRFLSMSNTRFDPGDMVDYRRIFMGGGGLDERAFDQLIVALKEQEILAPNLALLWRVPSVDGFDGGVLPLQRYIRALSLFMPESEVVPDGRLREQVAQLPDAALLNFLNVQYVMTDKVRDLWFENVYYDRQIGATLRADQPPLRINAPQRFTATRLDLIGYLEGDIQTQQALAAETVAAHVRVIGELEIEEFTLNVGADWADGALESAWAAQRGAQVAFRDVDGGRQEYIVRFSLKAPTIAEQIEITFAPQLQQADPTAALVVQAATLVDERTQTFVPLLPSGRGRFKRVHSGDIKIYENLDVLPRAYLAYQVQSAPDASTAFELVRQNGNRLGQVAIVEGLAPFETTPGSSDEVQMLAYEPERVEIRTRNQETALLVLSDSFYPGWRAWVDGQERPIYVANFLFRGVVLPAGEHTVVFEYMPTSWLWGGSASMVGIALWLLVLMGVKFAN